MDEKQLFRFKKMIICLLSLVVLIPCKAQGVNFQELREKVFARQTGIPYNENSAIIKNQLQKRTTSATTSWNNLIKTADRTTLWSDISFSTSADITEAYARLQSLAMAYVLPGGKLYKDQSLKADIISALDWLHLNKYNNKIASWDNWWDFKIGVPQRLNPIVILLYDELSQSQINNYMDAVKFHCNAIDHYTAANLAWIVNVIGTRAIIIGDEERLLYARNSLIPAIRNEQTGDGFYEDGSFIQHTKHPYNGAYGISFINSIIQVMQIFAGTAYAMPEECVETVLNWIYDGYEPLIFNGGLFAYVRGREISRSGTTDNSRGRGLALTMIKLRELVDEENQARLNNLIKYILTKDDTYSSPYDGTTEIAALVEIEKLMSNSSIKVKTDYEIYHQYVNMDRVVQQRPKYAFGVAMHSTRTYNYEMLNDENKKGWFTAAGMTYLYNSEGGQYAQNYWPTVDAYKMAGTTVPVNMTYARNKSTASAFVGGVEHMKKYGLTCMLFDCPSTLYVHARKSWFMFDNEIVALGSDIKSNRAGEVNTYIEQRRLSSDNRNTLIVDGVKQNAVFGETEPVTLNAVSWVHLSGKYSTNDSSIGYYFPTSVNLKATRKQLTGKWSDINKTGSSAEQKNYFLTLWKEHKSESSISGSDPTKYDYVIIPAVSKDALQKYASNPDIEILENSEKIHAVREKNLGITGIVFWEDNNDQKLELGNNAYLYSDSKSAVMYQKTDKSIIVSVSDPTQLNQGKITITLQNVSALDIIQPNDKIEVKSLSPSVELVVDVADSKGMTREIILSTDNLSFVNENINNQSVYARFSSDDLYLSFVSGKDEHAIITLYDMNGYKIIQESITVNSGLNEYYIPVSNYLKGVYIITLTHGTGVYKQKLIK